MLGALLALFLQKVAIAVLGFLAGGKLAAGIAASFFVHYAQYSTIIFVIGGIIGAILLLAVFGWALIVVSSFIGADLIQSAFVCRHRFDTRVHRPRNPRHIRAGSIVPPKCDISTAMLLTNRRTTLTIGL